LSVFALPHTHSVENTWTDDAYLNAFYSDLSTPMEVSIITPEGYLLIVTEISRVNGLGPGVKVYFRLQVDGITIAETRIEPPFDLNANLYKVLSFSGATQVSSGNHTVKLQAYSADGSASLTDDEEGFQFRKLTAIVFPTIPLNDSVTCCGSYNEFNCSQPICFGKSLPNDIPCSGIGVCLPPNKCECPIGYGGLECETQCRIPSILSTRLNMDATKIHITFNTSMHVTTFTCSNIFQDSETKFGVNATCKYKFYYSRTS
jgi:hypothetical protein